MSESPKRERFGRYLILDHLVDGGMAKICRARMMGEQADKLVAIKMVQPKYSADEGFKTMFLDELKVTIGLLHPNVIQTYDSGIHNGQLFVAMEYIDGKNLKEYLNKIQKMKAVFPVAVSAYIIAQACQGLHYAHNFKDTLTGKDANIIHRDISPHNIMLTYDGAVKIIDFGIAKSNTNSEATQIGTIKGKLSYLAPEYIEGILELDARYDQFALGITLWEMLCGQKLFNEKNDLAILKKIQDCKIPAPSSVAGSGLIPKELDDIVLKALSKDRENRYTDLDQMNRALMKFIYAFNPDFNATDLQYFANTLFKEEIKADREKLFEFGKIDLRPYVNELKKELESGTRESNNSESAAIRDPNDLIKGKEQVLDFGFEEEDPAKAKQNQVAKKFAQTSSNGLKTKTNLNINDSNVLTNNSSDFIQSSLNVKAAQSKVEMTKTRSTKIEPKNTNSNVKEVKNSPAGTIAALLAVVLGSGGYIYYSMNGKATVAHEVVANPIPKNRLPAQVNQDTSVGADANANKGNIVLSHFDKQKMQVFIDGHKVDVDLLSNLKVPMSREFVLRVQIEGRKHFIKELRVDNTSALEVEILETPAIFYGYMNTSSSCAQGEIRFEVFGEKRVSPIPMVESFGISLPLGVNDKGQLIPASYQLFFKKTGEEVERKIDITINHEDQTIDLCDLL